MSIWTSIRGTIEVNPIGRTQAKKRYVLETVLAHLPVITGSEADMQVYIVQPDGFDRSSNVDEFGYKTNNLVNHYGKKDRVYGSHQVQGRYILILDACYSKMFEFENGWYEYLLWNKEI